MAIVDTEERQGVIQELTGKVAVVTGGARKVGRAICRALGRAGAAVVGAWSCYWDHPKPCGSCPACLQHRTAFERIGCLDPLMGRGGVTG